MAPRDNTSPPQNRKQATSADSPGSLNLFGSPTMVLEEPGTPIRRRCILRWKDQGSPDNTHGEGFSQAYGIFAYGVIILVFSTVFNINAIVPRQSALYTPEYYERIVQAFHIMLMLLGIGLLMWQLVIPLMVTLSGRQLKRRKPKLIPRHVLTVAWILTTVSVIFLLWRIVFEAVFLSVDCDEAVKIPSMASAMQEAGATNHRETKEHRSFMIACDFVYYIICAVFLLLQCSYVHVWSKYRIPQDCCPASFPLNSVHILVVNLAIYVRMTLIEAKETYDHYEKYRPWLYDENDVFIYPVDEPLLYAPSNDDHVRRSRGSGGSNGFSGATQSRDSNNNHHDDWVCEISTQLGQTLTKYWKLEHNDIVEPFGFAMMIECLLTLALFVHEIMTHTHEEQRRALEEQEEENHTAQEPVISQIEKLEKPVSPSTKMRKNAPDDVNQKRKMETDTFMGHIVQVRSRFKSKTSCSTITTGNFILPWDMPIGLKVAGIFAALSCFITAILSVSFSANFVKYLVWYYRWAQFSCNDSLDFDPTKTGEPFRYFEQSTQVFLGAEMTAGLCLLVLLIVALGHQIQKRPMTGHALQDIKLLMLSMIGEIALSFFILLACGFSKKAANEDTSHKEYDDYPWDYLRIAFGSKSVLDILVSLVQTLYISRALGYKTYTEGSRWLLEAGTLMSVIAFNFNMWLVEVYGRKFTFRANFVASNFYDKPVWSIVNEVVYPISIFYRFHTLVLCISMLGTLLVKLKRKKVLAKIGTSMKRRNRGSRMDPYYFENKALGLDTPTAPPLPPPPQSQTQMIMRL